MQPRAAGVQGPQVAQYLIDPSAPWKARPQLNAYVQKRLIEMAGRNDPGARNY